MDLKPHLNRDGLAEYLKDEKTTARDEAYLKADKKRDEDDTDYQALYNKLMARTPPVKTMENLIFLLYTKGIYDVDGKLTMIPRSYFSAVQIVETGSQTNKTENFY
eukprot:4496371-Pleurochrysis_carterae.AAC.1